MEFLRSAASAGLSLFIAIAVCALAGALVNLLRPIRFKYGILIVTLVATGFIYRAHLPGYLFLSLAAYAFVAIISTLEARSEVVLRNRWRISCAAMVIVLTVFLAGRYYEWEARAISWRGVNLFFFALNMWAFLRLITFLWEFGSARIQRPTLTNYVLWVALPFTLLGPILRYSQFEPQLSSLGTTGEREPILSSRFLRRFALGALQLVLGVALTALQASIVGPEGGLSRLQKVLIGFSLAPWSFYLMWAGYFKLMESLAPFWGITLPPSFNRPFGRRNLSEFWANWNMSATSVFRDYFFYNRWGLRKANLYVNTLIVFLMVGLWHGLNGYWILFGLMHGLGFCAYLWYSANRSRLALVRQNLIDSQFRFTGPVATYLYVCSCWFLPPTILKLIR